MTRLATPSGCFLRGRGMICSLVVQAQGRSIAVDVSRVLKNAWELFAKDIAPLLVGGLIAGILMVLTLFILAGPLIGGLFKMVVRRVREARIAEIGDVFDCMGQLGTLFLATLVLSLSIALGLVLLIVPGLYLATIWVYVIPLIVDKRIGLGEAMSKSKELVMTHDIGTHAALLLLIGVGSTAVSVATGGAGMLLVVPFVIAMIGAMYFTAQGEVDKLAAAVADGGVRPGMATTPAGSADTAPIGALIVLDAGGPGADDAAQPPAEADDGAVDASPAEAPTIDPHSGRHALHCSQCGASLSAADEFCTVCATEVSGGHVDEEPAEDA